MNLASQFTHHTQQCQSFRSGTRHACSLRVADNSVTSRTHIDRSSRTGHVDDEQELATANHIEVVDRAWGSCDSSLVVGLNQQLVPNVGARCCKIPTVAVSPWCHPPPSTASQLWVTWLASACSELAHLSTLDACSSCVLQHHGAAGCTAVWCEPVQP